jgi:general secretion pathway protein B
MPLAAPTPPAAEAAQALSTLPDALRSAVTRLSFSGAVQSQDREQSFVLVDGRLAHEGDALAPGIVLERIEARALALRVDGRLIRLPL